MAVFGKVSTAESPRATQPNNEFLRGLRHDSALWLHWRVVGVSPLLTQIIDDVWQPRGLAQKRRWSGDNAEGRRAEQGTSRASASKRLKVAHFRESLEPSRSARRRSGTRALLDGRAEVARTQTTNRPSLVLAASACLQQPPARDRGCRIDTRTLAHLREFGHHRAFMGPTVIRYSTRLVETWCAPWAHLVPTYYNAVFFKSR
jgi:hypothetical protein